MAVETPNADILVGLGVEIKLCGEFEPDADGTLEYIYNILCDGKSFDATLILIGETPSSNKQVLEEYCEDVINYAAQGESYLTLISEDQSVAEYLYAEINCFRALLGPERLKAIGIS